MGFEQHDANPGSPFDERRVGLDHLSFDVESRDELDGWLARLDVLGISHSGITEEPMWDVLVFRDPDHVQLELIHVKPEAATLLSSERSRSAGRFGSSARPQATGSCVAHPGC